MQWADAEVRVSEDGGREDGGRGAGPSLEEVAQLADSVIEQVGVVRQLYGELQAALGEPEGPPRRSVGEHTNGTRNGGGPELARLMAMEMAVAGSSREEAKAYLREALGIEDGEAMLDEVFERGEPGRARGPLRRRLFSRRRD